MHFTCKYQSGTKFGTGSNASNYIATVASTESNVNVSFQFRSPPQGKSNPAVTDAKIASLQLTLTTNEALQLAASIIAQAHHPMLHDSTARWIPPQYMPILTKNRWARSLEIQVRPWHNEISITNKTKFHIGKIKFSIDYRTHDEQYNYDDRKGIGTDHSLWFQFEFLLGAHAAHKF